MGWEHGKQHGQDPYMFFDAGATIDAVMLYEANEKQFNNMLIQWPNYMRNNRNNMVIGNSSDLRLLDSLKRNTPAEFTYRTKKGYSDVYREGLAKGIFMHDISRSLWSSKRGIDIKDWAIVYGHSISEFKREYDLIPYEVIMKFDEDNIQGTITIINHSDEEIKNLSINYIENYHWESIKDNIPIDLKLKPKSKNIYTFIVEPRKDKAKKELILGYKLTHPRFPQYISYTQRSKIDYDQYAYGK